MKITKKSPFSDKVHTREINVTEVQINKWLNSSQPIQIVLPHLTAEEREFLMTGITNEEWEEAFGSAPHDTL